MNSCELVTFVNAIACAIAKCTPKEDLPLITAVLGQLSSTLRTIAIQEEQLGGTRMPPVVTPGTETISIPPIL